MRSLIFAGTAAAVLAILSLRVDAVAKSEINANRNPITIGETVTLRWPFTGKKITVTGGSFKGKDVTTLRSLADTPRKTTRYTFDVVNMAKKAGTEEEVPIAVRHHIDVVVLNPAAHGLVPFKGGPSWTVNYLKGWKVDRARVSGSNLAYFQKEDDSVERMAVADLPTRESTCEELMEQIKKDFYSQYEQVEILSQESVTHHGIPAQIVTFSGNPVSHPSSRTQSTVLAMVRNGRAYVVSARALASRYSARKPLIDSMVMSFELK